MMTIEYTSKYLEGEPGPNFYWRGTPFDFLNLVSQMHVLGRENGAQIHLNKIDFVRVLAGYEVMAKSSNNGNTLCRIDDKKIIIDLSCSIWRSILNVFLGISFFPSHNYIDFEELSLRSDANFIVSSEGV